MYTRIHTHAHIHTHTYATTHSHTMGIDMIFKVGGGGGGGGGVGDKCAWSAKNFYPIVSRTLKYALKISNLLQFWCIFGYATIITLYFGLNPNYNVCHAYYIVYNTEPENLGGGFSPQSPPGVYTHDWKQHVQSLEFRCSYSGMIMVSYLNNGV